MIAITIQLLKTGTAGDWSTGADRVSGVASGALDDAVINSSNAVTVNVMAVANPLTLNNSTLTDSGTLTLGTSPTVDGAALMLSNGTLSAQSLTSDNGMATYASSSGSDALVFPHTVKAEDSGLYFHVTGLNLLNSSTVHDAAGNDVSSVAQADLGLQIDATAPTLSSITATGSGITNSDGGLVTPQTTPDLAVTELNSNAPTIADSPSININLTDATSNPAGTVQVDVGSASGSVMHAEIQMASASESSANIVSSAMAGAFAIQGIGMSTYGLTNYEGPSYQNLLTGASIDGANYVELSNEAIIDLSTGAISDWIVTNGSSTWDQTAKFSDMGPSIAAAEAQGLNVMLKPQIAAYDPSLFPYTGSNFGNLTDPNLVISNPTAFFSGYKAYLLQWAELAQQYHVSILSIGNEMLAATKPQYTAYWDDIISSIRQVYSGELTYSALLPLQTSYAAGNEAQQIQFWNKLDFAGFDVYPSLTNQLDPSISQLNAAWQSNIINGTPQSYVQSIAQLAESIGKPVLFTETGVGSFPGANDRWDYNSDVVVGLPTTQSDYAAQSNWWASFFDTWAVNKPSWLSGIFIWDNDPGNTPGSVYYDNGYNINGKPAEFVVSSWFGGKDYLPFNQSSFTGTVTNDQIYLYGNQINNAVLAANGKPVTLPETFSTTISLTIDGTIIKGTVPTIHVYLNGIDEGAQTLTNTPGSYVDSHGITWTVPETLNFTLTGLANLSQLKIAIDSPYNVGGVENAQTFISSVTVDGVAMTQATYFPLVGSSQSQTVGGSGTTSTYTGGYTLIDPSPWNSKLANIEQIGSLAQPIQVSGGGGADTVYVLGVPADYQINEVNAHTVTLTENAGLNQNAILTDISYVVFQNGSLFNVSADTFVTSVQQEILGLYAALYNRAAEFPGYNYWTGIVAAESDASGVTNSNAGTTAVTLNDATVLGQDFVNTQATFFNQIYASLTDSNFINALYVNIGGNAGDPSGIAYWAALLQMAETGTPASAGVAAVPAESVQAARAGLVGQFVHDLVDFNLAAAASGLTAAQLLAATQRQGTINDKIAVSLAYSNASQGPGGAILDPQTIGDAAFVAATTIIQNVTYDPTTVTTAITGINAAVAAQNLHLI